MVGIGARNDFLNQSTDADVADPRYNICELALAGYDEALSDDAYPPSPRRRFSTLDERWQRNAIYYGEQLFEATDHEGLGNWYPDGSSELGLLVLIGDTFEKLRIWQVHQITLLDVASVPYKGGEELISGDEEHRLQVLAVRDPKKKGDEVLLLPGLRTDPGCDVFRVEADFPRRIQAQYSNSSSSQASAHRQAGFKHPKNDGEIIGSCRFAHA